MTREEDLKPDERADAGEESRRYGGTLGVDGEPSSYVRIEPKPAAEVHPLVARYLINGEDKVIATRYHWAMLAGQTAILLASFIVAIGVNIALYSAWHQTPATRAEIHGVWIIFAIVCVWYAAHSISFHMKWLVITPVRILTISGVLTRKVDPLPMKRIRDCQLARSVWARMLGYGTISTESLATDHALSQIDYVPHPDDIYSAIWQILMPRAGQSPMPDEVG
jgi:membrane protein YdbS with pleckstrin-like domain